MVTLQGIKKTSKTRKKHETHSHKTTSKTYS